MMLDDGRIDFSPLDPTRDPEAFARTLAALSRRLQSETAPRVWEVLTSHWRPALALAASFAVVIWLPQWALRPTPEASVAAAQPHEELVHWSRVGGVVPAEAFALVDWQP